MKRIFIVGVARSGTTLLQSMLAAHPLINSFPETHFFTKFSKNKIIRFFSFVSKKENQNVLSYLKKNNYDNNVSFVPKYTFSKKKWVKQVLNVLDLISNNAKKQIWVEKTPMHLYYTDLICSVDENVTFIHVIRNGKDNVASLFEASNKYPQHFRQNKLSDCINRYKKEIKISKSNKYSKNHIFVRYESIIKEPKKTLLNLFSKLNIEYDDRVLDYKKHVAKLINTEEKWKIKNSNDLSFSNKYNEIFDSEQKNIISSKLKNIDLSVFDD